MYITNGKDRFNVPGHFFLDAPAGAADRVTFSVHTGSLFPDFSKKNDPVKKSGVFLGKMTRSRRENLGEPPPEKVTRYRVTFSGISPPTGVTFSGFFH